MNVILVFVQCSLKGECVVFFSSGLMHGSPERSQGEEAVEADRAGVLARESSGFVSFHSKSRTMPTRRDCLLGNRHLQKADSLVISIFLIFLMI